MSLVVRSLQTRTTAHYIHYVTLAKNDRSDAIIFYVYYSMVA